MTATAAAEVLAAWGEEREWAGTDPYDGLNATRLVGPLVRSRRGRQAVTQLVKRSPVDLRRPLGIPPRTSAATLAHVVSGYAALGQPDPMMAAVERLRALRLADVDELCWGYHFDVQTRVFFYPEGHPNTIATAFAGLALLDAYALTGDRALLGEAAGVGEFFIRHVPQTATGTGAFFGYLIGDRTPIHNANMLVAALLARLHAAGAGDADLAERAAAAVRYTAHAQRPDGSWPYGEVPHLGWVDNFHTGYVLDCLRWCADAGIDDADEGVIARGLALFRRDLVLPDGTPRYSTTSTLPIDGQCVAQTIQTFALARDADGIADARRTLAFAQERMARGDGSYLFQRRRFWRNAVPHVRWVQAPMFAALARLARRERELA